VFNIQTRQNGFATENSFALNDDGFIKTYIWRIYIVIYNNFSSLSGFKPKFYSQNTCADFYH